MSDTPFAHFPKYIFFLLLAAVTLLVGYILRPFFFAIF